MYMFDMKEEIIRLFAEEKMVRSEQKIFPQGDEVCMCEGISTMEDVEGGLRRAGYQLGTICDLLEVAKSHSYLHELSHEFSVILYALGSKTTITVKERRVHSLVGEFSLKDVVCYPGVEIYKGVTRFYLEDRASWHFSGGYYFFLGVK